MRSQKTSVLLEHGFCCKGKDTLIWKDSFIQRTIYRLSVKSKIITYITNYFSTMNVRMLPFKVIMLLGWFLAGIGYLIAQDITVSGTVNDAAGDPLPGATIMLKGTASGTFADESGSYSIEVPTENTILVFSYIGYLKQEIEVGTQTEISIQLEEGVNQLEDIVIVGYGTQEAGDVTGSVSSVKGSVIENLPVQGASEALQGRAAGVSVVRSGGAPGAGGDIRIRGTGTVNNANPLIVIDGVPVANANLNDINPNDIESIEVLKDASTAAIYGLRAANGVVIVTTKRGGFNEKISFSLNAYGGISNAVETLDVLEADELADLKIERYVNDGVEINPVWQDPAFRVQRTDWQEELFDQGTTQNYDFSMRGGGERSSFSISGGYFEEEGIIKNSFYERTYLRINSDHQVNDWLKIGENLQLTRQRENGVNTNSAQSGVIWSAIRFHPSLPVLVTADNPVPGHEIGDYGSSSLVPNSGGEFGDINNPVFTVTEDEDDASTNHVILGNIFAEFDLAELFNSNALNGLKVKGNFALDATIFDRDRFEIIIDRQIRARDRNQLIREYREGYSLLAEYFLSYDRLFGNHGINFVGGYTAQRFNVEGFGAERLDFPNEDPDQRFLNAGNTIDNATGFKTEDALESGFARLNYNYAGKYLVSATYRRDGSSKFAPGNKWGNFPAFSAGWRISEESFMDDVSLISNLKVTGSWGRLGNQEVVGLQYLALISSGRRYSFGGGEVVGASQSRYPNQNISWETTEMTDFGLDIGFLDNRLIANINYFIKDTEDMLLAPPTVGTQGRAEVPDQNVGEVRNEGLEFELSFQKGTGDFRYNISGNISFIQNEVRQLNGEFLASRFYGRPNQEISRTFEGEPIGTFFGWITDGLYQTQGDIDADPNITNDERRTNGQIQPGDVRFVDLNGDGAIDEQDRTILGDPFPDAEYGLNAAFQWKGLDLTLFFLGQAGLELYNADRMQGLDPTYPFNLYEETLGRWNGPGTSNSIPRMTLDRNNLNHRTSDLFIEDGDFFRLKNLTLGYTIPSAITETVNISRVRFYVTGQNVFTVTDYSGFDPELGYVDGNRQRGVDYAQYPLARTWIFGATLGF